MPQSKSAHTPWQTLLLLLVFNVVAGAGAAAQTVVVRKVPPGATVELVLNSDTVETATADTRGDATLPVNLSTRLTQTETLMQITVDQCGEVWRVFLVERGRQPALPGADCDRREIIGSFLVRRVSTLVLDVSRANPTVLLRQGSVDLDPPRPRHSAPTGLVLFGGGGFAKFSDVVFLSCGNVPECGGDDRQFAFTAGGAYWMTKFLAAEVSYVRPSEVTVSGSGGTFRFDSFLDVHMLTVMAKVGVPVGPARFYGGFGTDYHWARFGTNQTVDDTTITIDDEVQTIEGGTQAFELKTQGWGWTFGGGGEFWLAPSFAIYAEVSRAWLKGDATEGGDGAMDDRTWSIFAGGRVRIGW